MSFRIRSTAALAVLAIAAGCASHPRPATVAMDEGPEIAISQQQEFISQSEQANADVLAPTEIASAHEQLNEAREELKDGDKKEAFEKVGISKAYVERANAKAEARTAQTRIILDARQLAIKAGARDAGHLEDADNRFRQYTMDDNDFKRMDSDNMSDLRARYLRSELVSIKQRRLGEVERTLAEARAKGAPALVPKSYNDAFSKYRSAEAAIEADRNSQARYRPAIVAAALAANNTLSLTETAVATQNMSPEERARAIEQRNKALQEADQLNAKALEANMAKEDALAAQGAALGLVAGQNANLRRREMADKAVKDAEGMFDSSEADVYRQGDNLVIRLKKVKFPSGRADLPADSMPILTKVKTVMQDLSPSEVKVEGHTDSVGAANLNQKLSEDRAASVAKYFESDSAFERTEFETAGYGYSKPLTSNKTKDGRAMNRRVDIVITPGSSNQ
jgi:OOP family OmpA-OmpF porin